jgi:hypothetical protein
MCEHRLVVGPKERERTLARIRKICLALPETSERLSHGAPTFFVREKRAFLMVLTNHHGDGRFAIWCAAPDGVQQALVADAIRDEAPSQLLARTPHAIRCSVGA